ncbi:peptide chain release factor N(5)-glutamine methyltransferase [Companilactobacillus sp. DQM5]|uniref:peptide chain release factor N(5)-glutamine methyltransferase n=1 Tax=Companilactobacillus sp. DQM5 TaxID=3463359 RepID=UPI004057E8D0
MEKRSYSNALERAFLILKEHNVNEDVATYLMEEMLGWTSSKYSLHKNDEMSEKEFNNFFELIDRAKNNEPPQYILKKAWFYGREFIVSPDTLIPRQETEELVKKILDDINKTNNLSILDIGTGTGDISVTLKLEKPDIKITGSDISKKALQIAKRNSEKFNVDVNFIESDLFSNINSRFDIIISNPPYISKNELDVMDDSVKKYEPGIALFAEEDGLKVYRRIFDKCKDYLTQNGIMYLEFGYRQKDKIHEMIKKQLPNFEVEFFKDISGNWRYLKIYRKKN